RSCQLAAHSRLAVRPSARRKRNLLVAQRSRFQARNIGKQNRCISSNFRQKLADRGRRAHDGGNRAIGISAWSHREHSLRRSQEEKELIVISRRLSMRPFNARRMRWLSTATLL